MAKINPVFGKFQGKLGGTVFAIRNGEQILREYNPAPLNPSTPGQVKARAKLKLLSQLSAVMAPVIAIPKKGAVTSRNMFVKTNYGAAAYSGNQADIVLTNVKLTRSVVALPIINVVREGTTLTAKLSGTAVLDVDRVVYCCFLKQNNGELRYKGSNVVSVTDEFNHYETTFALDAASNEVVIYAYGVRDNTENARAVFANMQTIVAEDIAKLIVTRTLLDTDITLTDTSSVISAPTE